MLKSDDSLTDIVQIVTFESGNPSIAKVTKVGTLTANITPVTKGTTNIIVKIYYSDNYVKTISLKVYI